MPREFRTHNIDETNGDSNAEARWVGSRGDDCRVWSGIAHAATVTWQATGVGISLANKSTPQQPADIALGKPLIFTFTIDDGAAPEANASTPEQAIYPMEFASTVQIGNYVTGVTLDSTPGLQLPYCHGQHRPRPFGLLERCR